MADPGGDPRVPRIPPFMQSSYCSLVRRVRSKFVDCNNNESTAGAGADASVEVPKLHNIKLLIAFIHTLYHDEYFCINCTQTKMIEHNNIVVNKRWMPKVQV